MEEIVENVTNTIRCSWMKWREATEVLCDKNSTIKGERRILLNYHEVKNAVWIRVLEVK